MKSAADLSAPERHAINTELFSVYNEWISGPRDLLDLSLALNTAAAKAMRIKREETSDCA